jgi:hypothetical protein
MYTSTNLEKKSLDEASKDFQILLDSLGKAINNDTIFDFKITKTDGTIILFINGKITHHGFNKDDEVLFTISGGNTYKASINENNFTIETHF